MANTMKSKGYEFIKFLGVKMALFKDVKTNNLEVWVANKDHAGYSFSWHRTDWEFAFSYKE
jgi:hypothetical protein